MMNLATRCTACGTIFRVVQDQLKVSDGWVRCGRCQAVFNAQQTLFDLDHEAPPAWHPPEMTSVALESQESPEPFADTPNTGSSNESVPEPAPSNFGERHLLAEQDEPSGSLESPDIDHIEIEPQAPAPQWPEGLRNEFDADIGLPADQADLESESLARTEAPISDLASPSAEAHTDARAAAEVAGSEADSESAPSTPDFVRQAERDEWWEQSPVRAALVALALTAALGLALQVAGHYRQYIAAQWPESTPWLQHYCEFFGCRLEPLRRIDDVSIESTALTQADSSLQRDGASNALRLAVTLRNRGELPIAMPSLDLSLTGADGELVSRRSLSPADFQVGDPRLVPGADALLSVSFSVTGRRVSGYTVEVFYP